MLACGAFRLQEGSNIKEIPQEENAELIKKENPCNKENNNVNNGGSNVKKIWVFVKKPEIYKPIFFIFFFMVTPSAGSSMFYFYTNELKFHPNFMGQLKLIHSLANMIGIFTYHRFLKFIPFKKIFAWSTVICTCTGLTQVVLVTRFNFKIIINRKWFFWNFLIIFIIKTVSIFYFFFIFYFFHCCKFFLLFHFCLFVFSFIFSHFVFSLFLVYFTFFNLVFPFFFFKKKRPAWLHSFFSFIFPFNLDLFFSFIYIFFHWFYIYFDFANFVFH